MSERVSSLTLVSPTFHGAVDPETYPSPFEDSLPAVYHLLDLDPARGHYMLRCLTQVTLATNLDSYREDSERRAGAVLRLPPREFAKDLFLPLSTVENFTNYMHRISADESYNLREAIGDIRCPILLLTGTHDAAINTKASRDILEEFGRDVIHATVLGAGHHIHLLQYSYFKYALECFLLHDSIERTARLKIDRLAG
jgi:pimeloyl-ACP methyl ester carboxylesterase